MTRSVRSERDRCWGRETRERRRAGILAFDFTAIVGVDYELDSDKTDGNAARLNAEFTGNRYYGWAGESLRESIGDGGNITVVHSAEFSGSWRVSAESFDIP